MEKSVEEIEREIFNNSNGQGQSNIPGVSPALLKLFPPEKIERIKKKSLRKFAASQDKQWRNFLEAVSE